MATTASTGPTEEEGQLQAASAVKIQSLTDRKHPLGLQGLICDPGVLIRQTDYRSPGDGGALALCTDSPAVCVSFYDQTRPV